MHITQKLIEEIICPLKQTYDIDIPYECWNMFMTPLTDPKGQLNINQFTKRQEASIEIIRLILGYHAKQDIVKFLAELASIEPKIQELQPWVRDHVVHAINTFILGVYILQKVKFPVIRETQYDYPFMWKLCGPTHDLGYPLEIAHNIKKPYVDKMNSILSSLNSISPQISSETYPKGINILSENLDSNVLIQDRLNEWGLDIEVENYYEWLESENKVDHGVISALSQLKVIEALYYSHNPLREPKDIFRENHNWNQNTFNLDIISSSAALFVHNIDLDYAGFTKKISFGQAPLAFLLFLCDTLQEWDRYTECRPIYSGNDFRIICDENSISVIVPRNIEERIFCTLNKRLSGLLVFVNNREAIQ